MHDSFIGRDGYLELLTKRVSSLMQGYRQNVAIVGEEMVGKTTLLVTFLKRYADCYIVPVYLEVRPEPYAVFARRFIGVLLYNFLLNSGIPLKEELPFLIQKAGKYLPRTIEKITAILASLEKRKQYAIITELFSLTDILHEESGKYCVIILDEFQNLEHIGLKSLYAEWSKLLISSKTTLYIIASSTPFKARAILGKNLSLLFGNFEVVHLEPFDIPTSEAYIDRTLQTLGIAQEWKNFIVNFTGGYPLYLEIILRSLRAHATHDLVSSLEAVLFDPAGILHQRFMSHLKRFTGHPQSREYLSILYAIASGSTKLKEIAQILHRAQKHLQPRIQYLQECDVVMRSGDFLSLADRVFSFWLKFVYHQQSNSLTFDVSSHRELFRSSIQNMIDEFLRQEHKTILERLTEVITLFEDETVHIGPKRVRLARFREIKPLNFTAKGFFDGLLCRSPDALWIMAFSREQLSEDGVLEFSRECKKYRNKTQRRIIVTLNDMDTNARLRALEEKILTWDLNNVNRLLDLYSKPRIIA